MGCEEVVDMMVLLPTVFLSAPGKRLLSSLAFFVLPKTQLLFQEKAPRPCHTPYEVPSIAIFPMTGSFPTRYAPFQGEE
jgi:hypothetical protein